MKELPEGWEWAELGALAASEPRSITDGPFGSNLKTSHYTKSGPRVIRLQNIGDGRFEDDRAHISEDHFISLVRHSVQPGDVLIASLGRDLPRSCIAPEWLGPAIVKADCIRFRAGPRVDGRFVSHMLNSRPVRRGVAEIIHGVGRPRLNLREIKSIQVPVPPRDVQEQIIGVIEEQFSRLDAGVETLQRAKRKLTVLRASLLNQSYIRPDVEWTTMGEVARIDAKLVDPGQYTHWPHVAPNHIESHTGRLLPHSSVGFDRVTSAKYLFRPGEVLYSKIRPYLAKSVVAEFEGLCSADMYPLATGLDPKFLNYWLLTARFTSLAARQQGRSVLPKINREALFRLPAPIADDEVQQSVVAEVERQFSIIDAMAKTIEAGLRRASTLRQSILSQAFSGKLTGTA